MEIKSVQKQLGEILQGAAVQAADIKSDVAEAKAALDKIVADKANVLEHPGLQNAYRNLVSALRVVEGGDRPVPAQAIAVYQESTEHIKARTGEWKAFKQAILPVLNERLRQASIPAIALSGNSN